MNNNSFYSNNLRVSIASAIIFISSIAVTVGWKWKQRSTSATNTNRSNGDSEPTTNIDEIHSSGEPPEVVGKEEAALKQSKAVLGRRILCPGTITVVYASTTGTCESLAQRVVKALTNTTAIASSHYVQICPVSIVDWWDELLNEEEEEEGEGEASSSASTLPLVIFLIPTWTNGSFPPSATLLEQALQELSTDWRIAPKFLSNKLSFAIFGMGSTAYDSTTFNRPSKTVLSMLKDKLGARLLIPLGQGDDSVGDFYPHFELWLTSLQQKISTTISNTTRKKKSSSYPNRLKEQPEDVDSTSALRSKASRRVVVRGKNPLISKDSPTTSSCCSTVHHDDEHTNSSNVGGSCCQSTDKATVVRADDMKMEETKDVLFDDNSDSSSAYDSWDDEDGPGLERQNEPDIMDVEDLGTAMMQTTSGEQRLNKEMVTPKQAAALKKEGYKLIGTHSAVKLCRWTKHQLRGRGGCYKHTFYGITSYQCMEATPSLACANKCVFCWRHHKNPVGKEWRWKTDDPQFIVAEAVKIHVSMIKEARGIPGVVPQRYQEALTVRHCALSLVGEPIMYPRINELLADLHSRNISSFLVTNGQHPEAIETLIPVTQLYVSVDAPSERTLIDIDRPLFKDAWDRLRRSLSLLKNKRQRTVARLTVVKGWNSDEVQGYAELIALGHVSLVEVKGVTFCGKSDASNLNMSNTPWHHEVVALTVTLQKELAKMTAAGGANAPPLYDIACEHKHSCCIVLARVDQFAFDDPVTGKRKWKTWIDFDKFLQLSRRFEQDPSFTFGVEDYTTDTPPWATFGSEEEGFDPTDQRYRKKGKAPLYTKFDSRGVPTHGFDGVPLSEHEFQRLNKMMDEKIAEMGSSLTVVNEMEDGAKSVVDPSLMFRGLVVSSY
jgi:tRNA wybutosine-synthesizing protein 1